MSLDILIRQDEHRAIGRWGSHSCLRAADLTSHFAISVLEQLHQPSQRLVEAPGLLPDAAPACRFMLACVSLVGWRSPIDRPERMDMSHILVALAHRLPLLWDVPEGPHDGASREPWTMLWATSVWAQSATVSTNKQETSRGASSRPSRRARGRPAGGRPGGPRPPAREPGFERECTSCA